MNVDQKLLMIASCCVGLAGLNLLRVCISILFEHYSSLDKRKDDQSNGNKAKASHNYRQQDGEILFPNGSKVILGNFKDEKDIDKYLGQEYGK